MRVGTFASFQNGTGRNQLLTQTLASATETEFKVGTDTVAAGAIAVLTVPQGTGILGSANPQLQSGNDSVLIASPGMMYGPQLGAGSRPFFSSTEFDNDRPFILTLAGVATPVSNAANSLTLNVYLGTSKSGTKIATTGAITGTETSTAASPFLMEVQLFWDSVSQILGGQFWYSVQAATPAYHTWQTNTAQGTSVALSGLNFVASAQWGNAVGGSIVVGEFSLSYL